MTDSVDDRLVSVGSRLREVWRGWGSKHGLLGLLLGLPVSVHLTVSTSKLVLFLVTDHLIVFLVFIVLVILTFGAFIIPVQLTGQNLTSTLFLHPAT